ncbi:MAG: cobaltochelatase subunit CobN [Methanosarcinales archaeon]|nr:cobaltochelatase subunit CobN [Methanosarcinales archaeon]
MKNKIFNKNKLTIAVLIAVAAVVVLITAAASENLTFTPTIADADQHVDIAIVTGYTSHQIPLENITTQINTNVSLNITVSYYLSDRVMSEDIDLSEMEVIYINMIGAQTALRINETIEDAISKGAVVIDDNTLLNESIPNTHNHDNVTEILTAYWVNSAYDETNLKNLIFYLAYEFCDRKDLVVEDPIQLPVRAVYHPDMPELFCEDLDDYLEWYGNRTDGGHVYNASMPTIGIAFYNSYYPFKIEPIDTLIEEFELQNINVLPFYSSSTKQKCDPYLKRDGEPVVDVIISFTYFNIKFTPEDIGVPVINAIINNYMNRTQWECSSHPLPTNKMLKIDYPELVGAIDPIVIAATEIDPETDIQVTQTIDYQVEWLVNRTIAQINLGEKDEKDKKVAIIYYNHGGGKDNIGASYLDVAPSMCNLLGNMSAVGYNINMTIVPNKTILMETILNQGINVGIWAPGVLENLVSTNKVELIPEATYEQWFMELPSTRREEVLQRWGPLPGDIMVWENDTGKYLVIPRIDLGDNVMLAPQPTRGWLQNNEALYHDKELAPHHQYIAFYLWLQKEYEADAIIHFGRHGTQEWLPGKQFGLSRYDWPSIMVGDLPVIYPYVMDGLGEGNQAKRRGNAVIVDHLVPPIIAADLYGNYTHLEDEMLAYDSQKVNLDLKAQHRAQIINLTRELHLDEQLGVDLTQFTQNLTANQTGFEEFLEDLEHLLDDLKSISMPYGLHILGTSPHDDKLIGMVNSMLGRSFANEVIAINNSKDAPLTLLDLVINRGISIHDAQMQVFGPGNNSTSVEAHLENALIYSQNLAEGENEVLAVLDALDGKYISPNPGTDPVQTPDALPSGRNFFAFDQRRLPTTAAWELGQDMVNKTLELHLAAHNETYPKKMAYILWAGETTRHEGVMEAQMLYLLGINPKWENELDKDKGKVIGVEPIPSESLSRPRIDVVIVVSGLYRDMFPDKMALLDESVRLAYEQNATSNCPNYIKENADAFAAILMENDPSLNESDALDLALLRVFGCADGTYGPGLANPISASNTWDDTDVLAQLFIDRMGNVYRQDVWGKSAADFFEMNLADVELTMYSRSSNLYGVIDNDDFFQYLGGLNLAVTYASGGNTPDPYVTNLREVGDEGIQTLGDFISDELYARYFNPEWIDGMQNHGYAGAREMKNFVENLWGLQVTNPELIPDWVWDRVYETYINNPEMSKWLKQSENSFAYQSMIARMLEVNRKTDANGDPYWDADEETISTLVNEYVESVADNGAACCHHTCGNPTLDKHIQELMPVLGVSEEIADKYYKIIDEVNNQEPPAYPTATEKKRGNWRWYQDRKSRSGNETIEAQSEVGTNVDQAPEAAASGEGYEIQDEIEPESGDVGSFSGFDILGLIIMILIVGAIYIGYKRKS